MSSRGDPTPDMEGSEYLPMFLAEAREHLQQLTLAVVRIEESPDDRETVDAIFRIAHSMKGMSATMGFAAMAALTHEMEDVFELLRQRRGGLSRDAIDVLLECLDAIEGTVDAIEEDGTERLDPAKLVRRLKRLVRRRSPEQEAARLGGVTDPAEALARAGGRPTLHVVAELAADCAMPGVRAFMVLAALGEHGEVVGSTPTEQNVEHFAGRTVEAFVATDAAPSTLAAAARSVTDVADAAVQAKIAPEPPAPRAPARKVSATVRIDADRLDQLMQLMGELVAHRAQVESLAALAEVPGLPEAMQDLTRTSDELQALVMQTRMIRVESVFLRFPRLVRDLSAQLGKQVELVLMGTDTQLDRAVVEALGDPIVHLVRNSLDHGLERPEERVAAGKPATGTLEIAARHAGGEVVITVRDDGRGIDPAKVSAKAVAHGLLAAADAASVDAARAVELLFHPGFTTAERTSELSGRGVGMDAVRTAIRELGGDVELVSEPGAGTTVSIRLPLTLAIVSALQVESRGTPFAIPLERVDRTLRVGDHAVRSVAGRRMLVLRDGAVPLADLAEALGHEPGGADASAVVVHAADGRVALAVDRIVGRRELVTRPLPAALGDRAGVSGGAVLPDGADALIVDCDAIAAPPLRAAA
jgi:two-component system, chemotaxis family, sensor kinase CheA